MAKQTKTRFGVYYRSNGRWTGPYQGISFTKYTITRNPVSTAIRDTKNYVLKSRIKLLPVVA